MHSNKSGSNVLYVNHTNSSIETGYYQSSAKPDSLSSIIKNATFITEYETKNSPDEPKKLVLK